MTLFALFLRINYLSGGIPFIYISFQINKSNQTIIFILFMQTRLQTNCIANQPSTKVCLRQNCKQIPFMCNKQQCQCQKHKDCQSINLKTIMNALKQKGACLSPVFEALIEWYEHHIKKMVRQLEEVRKIHSQETPVLKGEESRLYQLIQQKRSQEISSYHISHVLKILRSGSKINVQNKILDLKNKLAQRSAEIDQTLLLVKQYAKSENYVYNKCKYETKFSSNFHHPLIKIVNNNIKINTSQCYGYMTALLDFSVQKFPNTKQTYRFRIVSSECLQLMFGLCHLRSLFARNYTNNYGLHNGGYVIHSRNGQIRVHEGKEPKRDCNSITSIGVDDIVEIVYYSFQSKLEIHNLTKMQRDCMLVKVRPGDPLHPCVMMLDVSDQVEFMGMQLQQQ